MPVDKNGTTDREEVIFVVAITIAAESQADAWEILMDIQDRDDVVGIVQVRLKPSMNE